MENATHELDRDDDAGGEVLGCVYSPEQTSFAVWAPTADRVKLMVDHDQLAMTKKPNGVWHTTVSGNLLHARYHYSVTVNGEENRVNDPYAKAMTANHGQGIVIDLETSDPAGFRATEYPKVSKQDAVIYELHVRDATSSADSGVQHRGRFMGLTERNTRTPAGFSSGLTYFKQLGITHIQLLPVQDYARVDELDPSGSYNWGYDPLFYFVPEGSYATDPDAPLSRIRECKSMIQAIHQEGMSVILDVVFNHVYRYEDSAFEKLVPGYYFRQWADGSLSNGSGTGNDLATERRMVRKLIWDAVDYWLREYQVDGFRFDLMGAMDLGTMQAIQRRCSFEDRPILLLGEGWDLDTALPADQKATLSHSDQLVHVSFFNDQFRDTLKGCLFHVEDRGYVNGNGHAIERLPQLVAGSCDERFAGRMFASPLQSINYVECHDNHTLADRIMLSNPDATEAHRKRMHQLATGLMLLSQGIPFLHAGQEFYRSKQGDGNSYRSGDAVNQLNWEQRGREDEYVQWVRGLIRLRKQYRLFRLGSAEEIRQRSHVVAAPHPVFGYTLLGDDEDLAVYVNPSNATVKVELPAQGRWEKLAGNTGSALAQVGSVTNPETVIGGYELAVWKKDRC